MPNKANSTGTYVAVDIRALEATIVLILRGNVLAHWNPAPSAFNSPSGISRERWERRLRDSIRLTKV
jgi:hypothetical protein